MFKTLLFLSSPWTARRLIPKVTPTKSLSPDNEAKSFLSESPASHHSHQQMEKPHYRYRSDQRQFFRGVFLTIFNVCFVRPVCPIVHFFIQISHFYKS